jgi:hypothetical protein
MEQEIRSELKRIEEEKKIIILYAAESGSRAWGFASRNSDWDIRFIYHHPAEYYLSVNPENKALSEKGETFKPRIVGELDFHGWDIFKAARLLAKSNPPIMEWLFSPIKYVETGILAGMMRKYVREKYSRKALFYHYQHMADSNYKEHIAGQELVIRKKYLYVIRPALCIDWLGSRQDTPPTEFINVMNGVQLADDVKKEISELYHAKLAGMEIGKGPRSHVLDSYIENSLERSRGKELAARKPDYDELDRIVKTALFK